MLSTVLTALGVALGVGAAGYAGYKFPANYFNGKSMGEAEANYNRAMKEVGLADTKIEDVVNLAYTTGYIDPKDYDRVLSEVRELKNEEGITTLTNSGFFKMFEASLWTAKGQQQYAKLFNTLAEFAPNLKNISQMSLEGLPENVLKNFGYDPGLYKTPGPSYLNTNFKTYQREVDPVKLWTGQELADLHNINYDVNHYYDLIKQANEANLQYGNYTNDQALNTTRRNDEQRAISYLDSLRNVKSDAVANGTAAGARAAQEVLANVAASNERANAVSETLNNNLANIDQYILANAQSRLSAVDYFNQLAKSLSRDSATLYANDTNRYGADWNANAILYAADQKLRGERALANATMAGQYAQAKANMAAAQRGTNTLQEYLKYAVGSSSNPVEAYAKVNNWIFNQNTQGITPTVLDYMMNNNK